MALIWIGVAALLAALLLVLVLGRRSAEASARAAAHVPSGTVPRDVLEPDTTPIVERRRDGERSPAARPESESAAAGTDRTAPAPGPAAPPPVEAPSPALAAFRPARAQDLPEDRRTGYIETFKNIPRPPKLLHHLLSPDFVNASSASQLVDLIAGEPLLAARILTVVNSPLYGLSSPMSSIGQAVTYLGLNAVRSLCLQYVLIASFRPDSVERKRMVHGTWEASALGSELAQQLSQRLGFDDRGSMVSAVVLSFLGRLAIIASLSRGTLDSVAHGSFLERTQAEQAVLGLGASQIGRLLMQQWGLPERIVDDASEVDAVLWTPADALDPERGPRVALCYLCARLGERLAQDPALDLARVDPTADPGDDFFHLRGTLVKAPLAGRLLPALHAPELQVRLRKVLTAMRD
ncbi:MAG TPA: HDOD domain-containing protein [Caldimonas sp.]|nr:HDOD domain-containing protein [Caldimonas sp.]